MERLDVAHERFWSLFFFWKMEAMRGAVHTNVSSRTRR